MRLISLLILLLLFRSTPYASETVEANSETSETPPSVEEEATKLRSADKALELLADSLRSSLVAGGYLDPRIEIDSSSLEIHPGKRCILEKLQITGDMTSIIPVGTAFTEKNLTTAVEQILNEFQAIGYYYARATTHAVSRDNTNITVTLNIIKGPLVTLEENQFEGLKYTSPEMIRRHLTIETGDSLTSGALKRAERVAADIDFVSFQPPVQVLPRPGYKTADLKYSFREKKRVSLFGGGGYSPGDDAGMVWSVRATFRNLFGNGKEAQVYSERREKGRQALQVRYRQPLFLLGVGQIDFGVTTRDYRKEFYEFAANSKYRARLGDATHTGLELGWKRVEPSGSPAGFSRYTVGLSLKRATLDNQDNPRSGYELKSSLAYSHRRYSDDSLSGDVFRQVYNETRTALSIGTFHRILGNLIGHVALGYRGLETSEGLPPISELILVGGPGTVRGYRNDQFAAIRTAFGTLEPRYRFGQGYLFGFWDMAYINRPVATDQGVATEEFYRSGVGIGMAFTSEDRTVRLSLGWGRDAAIDQPRLSVELTSDI